MKFSEQWLREWVDPPVDTAALAEQLTMLGHEVEAVTPAAAELSAVLVGQVIAVRQVAGQTCCTVDYGAGGNNPVGANHDPNNHSTAQVVTTAPNVRVGGCYAYAPAGTLLPNGVHITVRQIKGLASHGMLCSAAELGLSDKADALLELQPAAKPGQRLADYLWLDDRLLEVSLTPNRGDCLSIRGLARELAAVNRLPLRAVDIQPIAGETAAQRTIRLQAADACPHYVGRVIEDIDITRAVPSWLGERLRRAGIRSVNAIVDITNYVMLELGQPMHAFDNAKLSGEISVRHARPGEAITLLNGERRELPADALLIVDGAGPVALAGIMGGEHTAVSARTRAIFLESAFFTPLAIAGRARRLGLQTDASHRYERGVDPVLQGLAVERATALIIAACGGRAGAVTEASEAQHLPGSADIALSYDQVAALLGKAMQPAEIAAILTALGMRIIDQQHGGITVRPPSWRFDLCLPADLIEELARLHGFAQFPATLPSSRSVMRRPGPSAGLAGLKQTLVERGFQEVISYSFVDDALQRRLFPQQDGIALMNAISPQLAVMRLSLWPGLLLALRHNLNRQQQRLRIFEAGRVFAQQGTLRQDLKLAGLIYGNIYPEQWDNPYTSSDIFDLKADVEALIRQYCGAVACHYYDHGHDHSNDHTHYQADALHPGQWAHLVVGGQAVGILGMLHPRVQAGLDIVWPVYLFELDMARLSPKTAIKYANISKFPSSRRDLSILVDEQASIADIQACIRASIKKRARDRLINLELFDVYQGEGIDKGKKSVTLGLTFQGESSTLADDEVEGMMAAVTASLASELDAQLRG